MAMGPNKKGIIEHQNTDLVLITSEPLAEKRPTPQDLDAKRRASEPQVMTPLPPIQLPPRHREPQTSQAVAYQVQYNGRPLPPPMSQMAPPMNMGNHHQMNQMNQQNNSQKIQQNQMGAPAPQNHSTGKSNRSMAKNEMAAKNDDSTSSFHQRKPGSPLDSIITSVPLSIEVHHPTTKSSRPSDQGQSSIDSQSTADPSSNNSRSSKSQNQIPYTCPECDKTYSCRKNVKRHRQAVHKMTLEEILARPEQPAPPDAIPSAQLLASGRRHTVAGMEMGDMPLKGGSKRKASAAVTASSAPEPKKGKAMAASEEIEMNEMEHQKSPIHVVDDDNDDDVVVMSATIVTESALTIQAPLPPASTILPPRSKKRVQNRRGDKKNQKSPQNQEPIQDQSSSHQILNSEKQNTIQSLSSQNPILLNLLSPPSEEQKFQEPMVQNSMTQIQNQNQVQPIENQNWTSSQDQQALQFQEPMDQSSTNSHKQSPTHQMQNQIPMDQSQNWTMPQNQQFQEQNMMNQDWNQINQNPTHQMSQHEDQFQQQNPSPQFLNPNSVIPDLMSPQDSIDQNQDHQFPTPNLISPHPNPIQSPSFAQPSSLSQSTSPTIAQAPSTYEAPPSIQAWTPPPSTGGPSTSTAVSSQDPMFSPPPATSRHPSWDLATEPTVSYTDPFQNFAPTVWPPITAPIQEMRWALFDDPPLAPVPPSVAATTITIHSPRIITPELDTSSKQMTTTNSTGPLPPIYLPSLPAPVPNATWPMPTATNVPRLPPDEDTRAMAKIAAELKRCAEKMFLAPQEETEYDAMLLKSLREEFPVRKDVEMVEVEEEEKKKEEEKEKEKEKDEEEEIDYLKEMQGHDIDSDDDDEADSTFADIALLTLPPQRKPIADIVRAQSQPSADEMSQAKPGEFQEISRVFPRPNFIESLYKGYKPDPNKNLRVPVMPKSTRLLKNRPKLQENLQEPPRTASGRKSRSTAHTNHTCTGCFRSMDSDYSLRKHRQGCASVQAIRNPDYPKPVARRVARNLEKQIDIEPLPAIITQRPYVIPPKLPTAQEKKRVALAKKVVETTKAVVMMESLPAPSVVHDLVEEFKADREERMSQQQNQQHHKTTSPAPAEEALHAPDDPTPSSFSSSSSSSSSSRGSSVSASSVSPPKDPSTSSSLGGPEPSKKLTKSLNNPRNAQARHMCQV